LDQLCSVGFVLGSLLVAFEQLVPASATFLSVMLTPLAGFVSMRSLGETDNGAALAIGTLISLSQSKYRSDLRSSVQKR
jgi:hypothetical protein